MKASVIVPVWNGREYLSACLDALLAQDYPDSEVIVVDDASTDGSADFVAENYPRVRLIRSEHNLGFAGACNVGIEAGQGEVLVLLNQDTRVCPGWLQALVGALQEFRTGVVGCKILYPDGKTIQHAGGWIEWPLGLAHHHGQGEQDAGQWDVPQPVEYVTGAAMAFRRDVLVRVGLLDEGFWPGYFEDADFCFRVREAGYEVWYTPGAVLTHEETTSLTDPTVISHAYQRGRLRFLLKHMPPHRFLTEFVPAEEEYQPPAIRGQESTSLRMVYLESMLAAAYLLGLRWQANERMSNRVVMALQWLRQQAWEEDWKKTEELAAGAVASFVSFIPSAEDSAPGTLSQVGTPSLIEFEFRSTVPIVGPLIARFRSLWHNVAARWAVHYLIQQQEAINRQQEAISRQQEAINRQQDIYFRSLEQRFTTLAAESGFLAQEIARLALQSDPGRK